MRPDKLADYIVKTHHAFIKNALSRFDVHLKTIIKLDSVKYPEVTEVSRLMEKLKLIMEQHLNLEEQILFPYISTLIEGAGRFGTVVTMENPLKKLKQEHAYVAAILSRVRELSNDYTPPVSTSPALKLCYAQLFDFEQDVHKHIFLEENILFPKLLALEKRN
jgi:regulator of cell morphogenesis and NO signaling